MKSQYIISLLFLNLRIIFVLELAYQTSQEALKISEESGDILSKAHAHYTLGLVYYCKGFLEEAEEHLLKSVDFCQKSNQLAFVAVANTLLGDTYLHKGE